MIRRWLIRVPFLLALAFVVGVWVASYFWGIFVHTHLIDRLCQMGGVHGTGEIIGHMGGVHGIGEIIVDRWPVGPYSIISPGLTPKEQNLHLTFGFYIGVVPCALHRFAIVFPLWLPTGLLAGLNGFVWKKTRHTGPVRGFPVEPATAKTQGADEPPRGS